MELPSDVKWQLNESQPVSTFGNGTTSGSAHDSGSSSESSIHSMDMYDSKFLTDMIRREIYNSMLSYDTPFTIFLMTVYGVAFVTGLLGNIFVILVVLRHEKMRTVTNVFLVNLALGDLLVVVFCMPFSLAPHVYRNWIYGRTICKLTPFLQGTSVGVSVFTLLSISVDRFLAILNPMKARMVFSKAKVKLIVIMIWLVAMANSLPLAVVSDVTGKNVYGAIKLHLCEEHWKSLSSKNVYNICMFVLLYCLPVICMIAAYCKISRVLWYGDRSIYSARASENPEYVQRVINGRRRIVRMLILLVAIFAALWFPYHVINIYLDLNRSVGSSPAIAIYGYPVVQWLALANSSTNPICYCFMSKSFRDSFRSMCICQRWEQLWTSRPKYAETSPSAVSQGICLERKTTKRSLGSSGQRTPLTGDHPRKDIRQQTGSVNTDQNCLGESDSKEDSESRTCGSSGQIFDARIALVPNGNTFLCARGKGKHSAPVHAEAESTFAL